MQIAGIGFCAIRGCEYRAIELADGIALCRDHRDLLEHALKTPPKLFHEVVYYVAWPRHDRVKIGTSVRLCSRLRNLATEARGPVSLLVAEPGSYSLERRRHRQFRSTRIVGTELFDSTPLLRDHIQCLRAEWPTWAELCGVGSEWIAPGPAWQLPWSSPHPETRAAGR